MMPALREAAIEQLADLWCAVFLASLRRRPDSDLGAEGRMLAAIYARKSSAQKGALDESKSVTLTAHDLTSTSGSMRPKRPSCVGFFSDLLMVRAVARSRKS